MKGKVWAKGRERRGVKERQTGGKRREGVEGEENRRMGGEE